MYFAAAWGFSRCHRSPSEQMKSRLFHLPVPIPTRRCAHGTSISCIAILLAVRKSAEVVRLVTVGGGRLDGLQRAGLSFFLAA